MMVQTQTQTHTPEQIVRKLREADRLLNNGDALSGTVGYSTDADGVLTTAGPLGDRLLGQELT